MSRLSVNIRCRQPSRVMSSPLLMSTSSFLCVVVFHACSRPRRQRDGPKRPFCNFIVQQPMKPLSKECLCRLQIDGIPHRDYNPLANKRPLRSSGMSVLISERRNSHISVNRTALSLRTAANEATVKEYSCRDRHTSSLTIRRSLGIAYFIRRTL